MQWGWRIAGKRWRKTLKWAPYPLLSCLLAFPSFSTLLLPKGRRRSKEADMKGTPEIVFLDALSRFCLPYRYGNVESQIQLAPMKHIVCLSLICLLSETLCLLSSPLLNPSSSSPSILSLLLSSAALGLLGTIAPDWQLLWQSVEQAESGWVSALLQGLKAAANVVASCWSQSGPWNKTQSPLLFSLLLSTEAGRSQIAFLNRSRVYSQRGNWDISVTHILPCCFSLPVIM